MNVYMLKKIGHGELQRKHPIDLVEKCFLSLLSVATYLHTPGSGPEA